MNTYPWWGQAEAAMQPLLCAHPEEPTLPILLGTRAFSWEKWARGLNEPESLKNKGDNSHHLSAVADGNLMGKKKQFVFGSMSTGEGRSWDWQPSIPSPAMGLAAITSIPAAPHGASWCCPSSAGPFTAEHFSKQMPMLLCIPSTCQLSLAFLSLPLTCKT